MVVVVGVGGLDSELVIFEVIFVLIDVVDIVVYVVIGELLDKVGVYVI